MSSVPGIDLLKVTNALKSRLPQYLGPWTERKTVLGQSNPTFILQGKNKTLVLRRKPDGELLKSAHMIDREYLVMRSLSNTKVPVPKVFYLCGDRGEIGTPYFVMEYIDGFTFPEPELPKLTIEQRQRVYDEMNRGLSELHKINPNDIGLGQYGKPGNYFERQLSIWSRQFENSATETIREMDVLKEWLSKNVPLQVLPSKLVHGDWRIDNLIFSKSDFSLKAVLDWELSTLGDPLADLATQLMQWSMPIGKEGRGLSGVDRKSLGIPEDKQFVELYSKRVGLTKVPDLSFPMALSYYKMGAILQGVRRRALDGNASNPEKAIVMGKYVKIFAQSALNYLKL
ncbi:MAG: phosphotransferase family protein [Rhodobacteraceae bacterium]|nr:MAG: phosphotransferase family protein [Paracoccaceae bacterium]